MVLRRQDRRGLTTLLFTDIVGSSDMAVELGDRRWRSLQAHHHAEVRRQLKRHGGHEVDTAGDGFFATFASPAAGVRCAFEIVREVRELGLDIRAGLHIGEAELSGEKVGGIAVTTAQRVESAAGPGQVLATDTIVHLVSGSGLEFTDLGSRELKGVPGRWELFSLDAVDGESIGSPLDAKQAAEYRLHASPVEQVSDRKRNAWRAAIAAAMAAVLIAGALLVEHGRRGSAQQTPAGSGSADAPVEVLDAGSGKALFPALPQRGWANQIVLTSSSGRPSTFAWVRSGGCAALNGCSGELAEINGDSGAIVQTFAIDSLSLAKVDRAIWFLVNDQGRLLARSIDVSTNELSRPTVIKGIAVGGFGGRGDTFVLAAGGGALWIGDTIGSRVFRLDLSSDRVERYQIEGYVDDVAFGGGWLWVMDAIRGTVTRVDPRNRSSESRSLNESDNLSSIAFGGGYLWGTDDTAGELWRVSTDLQSTRTTAVGSGPDDVVYANGVVWVANYDDESVSEVNPSLQVPAVSYPVGIQPRAVAVADGKVWVIGDVRPFEL
jgi:class 3 adenylate cyclase